MSSLRLKRIRVSFEQRWHTPLVVCILYRCLLLDFLDIRMLGQRSRFTPECLFIYSIRLSHPELESWVNILSLVFSVCLWPRPLLWKNVGVENPHPDLIVPVIYYQKSYFYDIDFGIHLKSVCVPVFVIFFQVDMKEYEVKIDSREWITVNFLVDIDSLSSLIASVLVTDKTILWRFRPYQCLLCTMRRVIFTVLVHLHKKLFTSTSKTERI